MKTKITVNNKNVTPKVSQFEGIYLFEMIIVVGSNVLDLIRIATTQLT